MAPTSICRACHQALRQQLRQCRQSPSPFPPRTPRLGSSNLQRALSTAHILSASPSAPNEAVKESLPSARPPGIEAEVGGTSTVDALAKEFRKRATSLTEPYVAYTICDKLMKECARQADYTIPQAREKIAEIPKTKDGEDLGVGTGWWFETLRLTPTFNTWAQITFLHMYLLTVRFRLFPAAQAPIWNQHLLDHFFYTAEERMLITHNIAARSIRNKYLKDLFVQWRGLIAGYDEGLMKGDAVLATAVWRNVFKADAGVDFRSLGQVVSYVRGVLKGLDGISDEGILGGEVVFGNPGAELEGVLVRSRLMDAPGQLAGGTKEAGGEMKAAS